VLGSKHIYLSYHNTNTLFAAQLTTTLDRLKIAVWFDRFEIHPEEHWVDQITTARGHANYAIIVVCQNYLDTAYCLQEYRDLYEADVTIIGVVVGNVNIADLQETIGFVDWVDFRDIETDAQFKQRAAQIAEYLPKSDTYSRQTERAYYLYELIADLETRLSQIPTYRAIQYVNSGDLQENPLVRPRGYDTSTLREWHLTSQVNQSNLAVEDLLTWQDAQQQFILSGKAGSGKTVIAELLTLTAAHDALSSTDSALPIWFNLALWSREQTLDDYIESQWPLAHYWKAWLETHHGLLVFDNLSDLANLNPDKLEVLNQWLATLSDHKIIFLTRTPVAEIQNPTQIVHIGHMPNTNIQRFARTFLSDDRVSIFKRLAYNNKDRLAHRHIDFVACGIELIAAEPQPDTNDWFTNPVETLIKQRWQAHFGDEKQSFSLNYFIKTLRLLSWYMLQQPYRFLIPYDVAEQVVFRGEVIVIAIRLGILDRVGGYIRFHAQLYASYLTIHHLVQDGLYVHLTHPRFDKKGQRQGTRWDDAIVALIDSSSAEQQARVIEQVSEIDPYLAYNCIQQYPDLYEKYYPSLVARLIELRSINAGSQIALTRTLHQLPDMLTVAKQLIEQLPQYSWNIQQWLWLEFLKLPLDIPTTIVQQIRKLDREFEDTMFDLLSDYEFDELSVYALYLMTHQDKSVRHNAIWLVGRLNEERGVIGLLNLLDHHTIETRQEGLHALASLATDDLLHKLLLWLDQYSDHTGLIGTVWYQNGRYVSGRFMMECKTNDVPLDGRHFDLLRTVPEGEIASDIATYLVVTDPDMKQIFDFVEINEDEDMNIQKLLQTSLEQLPRESLNRFVDDIQRVLTSGEKATTEMIAQRAQSAIESGRQQTDAGVTTPTAREDIVHHLNDEDWLSRLHAIESLGALPTEEALPLILQATDDSDVQVRLAAYNLLANFSEYEDARQKLIEAIADDDGMVVDMVTDLLKTENLLDTATLIALLDTDNVQQLAAVLDILCEKKDEDTLPYLIPLLDDNRQSWLDKSIADYAAQAIEAIGTPEALEVLEQSSYRRTVVMEPVVASAATSVEKKTYTTLEKVTLSLKVLRGDHWERAQKAARFLRELAQRLRGTDNLAIVQLLCDALSDEQWHVRWTVAEALGWLQDPEAIPYLVSVLYDDNWIVQVAVIRALVELDAFSSASDIAGLLQHQNNVVRETTVEALGELGNDVAIPYLEESLLHDEDFVRMASIKSLHALQGDNNIQHLMNGLNDNYIHVRWYAMEHLVPHFTEDNIPLLTNLLEDDGKPAWEEKRICDFAYEVLSRFDTPKTQQIINDWLEHNEDK